MEASWGENARDRRFLLASALRPVEAERRRAPGADRPCRHESDGARAAGAKHSSTQPLRLVGCLTSTFGKCGFESRRSR
jgi:hypothetical protein